MIRLESSTASQRLPAYWSHIVSIAQVRCLAGELCWLGLQIQLFLLSLQRSF